MIRLDDDIVEFLKTMPGRYDSVKIIHLIHEAISYKNHSNEIILNKELLLSYFDNWEIPANETK